jgi:membrane protein implicated in regulation of membrane protease activity
MLTFLLTHWKISGIAVLAIAAVIAWPILKWRIRREERQKVLNQQTTEAYQDVLDTQKRRVKRANESIADKRKWLLKHLPFTKQ